VRRSARVPAVLKRSKAPPSFVPSVRPLLAHLRAQPFVRTTTVRPELYGDEWGSGVPFAYKQKERFKRKPAPFLMLDIDRIIGT